MEELPRVSSLDVPVPETSGKSFKSSQVDRLYGYNRIFFKGRLIGGPDIWRSGCTFLMIFVPSVLWYVEIGVFIAEQVNLAVVVTLVPLLQLSPLVLLLTTSFCDPGIVPRQKAPIATFDKASQSYRTKPPPKHMEVLLAGRLTKLKWCVTCNIYRPPRCTHCAVCDNCIERFDHHCPWIGNCIGKRNYRSFFGFLVTVAILNAFVFVTSTMHFSSTCRDLLDQDDSMSKGTAVWNALGDSFTTALLLLYSVAMGWFTSGMVLYHSYLVYTNQTTYEAVKGAFDGRMNPYSRGAQENCQQSLCGSVRPRYFDPRREQLYWPYSRSSTRSGAIPAVTLNRYLPQLTRRTGSGAEPIAKQGDGSLATAGDGLTSQTTQLESTSEFSLSVDARN
mmetsp:Transcript_35849/g.82293  ORF Transcript_35849/g.82293 Transcript_35849/m.82293 type:complete len:391 (+) Transcript_35849:66-1238(+)